MTHQYHISGMTCGGCKASVEKALRSVSGVSNVRVDLETETAEIEMDKMISLSQFRKALPEKYTIQMKEEQPAMMGVSEASKNKWKQLRPLFLIFLYITVASVALHWETLAYGEMMLDFMGLFYIVFSFFKLLDLKGFPSSFAMYDPLAKRLPVYGWIYPFLETALGLMFLFRFEVTVALITTLMILGITTVGVTRALLDKKKIQCACLGTALKLPMTEATFIENTIMIVMALVMLFGFV
ncbi:heavy metal translocating P-type ATPase [Altibacter sp. HG106]|uniref:heavy metal translocating P-type ATPase n=1 Tax=Altibacter sp. HG106 TaxID=3023937 RepID=UPI002350DC6A|nr:heavy-metal-associated domain-containing protein [Altibacter sp. HG106]MDC7995485.1 heavy-metal-associated domain-containing protein [Altibacter sp. HG106]